ncbi:MAG: LPS export ABC transporter periplasmic protein LptC [Legionellales bacterium]|nr:LPS export ABC transporter periplasmic protein LptC [Legionellales bacterium]
MKIRSWLKPITLWCLIGAGLFIAINPQNPFYTPENKPPPLVDAYMTNAKAMRFNPDGTIREVLHMREWEHVLKSQSTEMKDLKLDVFRKDGSKWQITSKTGRGYHPSLSEKMEYVLLEDEVRVAHAGNIQLAPDWKMLTDALTIYPDYAKTDLPVLVLGPDNTKISAVGLKAHLETGYVEFMDKVKTEYLNPKAM